MNTWYKKALIGALALVTPAMAAAQIDPIYQPEEKFIDPIIEEAYIIDYPTLFFPDAVVVDITDPSTDNLTTPPTDTATPEPDPATNTPTEPTEPIPDPFYEDTAVTTEPEPDPREPYYPPETFTPEPVPEPPADTFVPPTTTDRPANNGIRPLNPRPTPEIEKEAPEECPPFDPLAREPVKCPKTEPIPVLPIPPYILLLTPLLAVFLFWAIVSYLSRTQNQVESAFQQKHLQNARTEAVRRSKTQNYQELLEFLSTSKGSSEKLDQKKLQPLLSKIELLGSEEMQNLGNQAQTAFNNNDKQALKPLLKDMAKQIRLENK